MPPPGATSFLIFFVVFDFIEFRCIGRVAMLGAFAIGADIFFAMLFIAGITFGGAIFEPEALELEAAPDFVITLFFATCFFSAVRTGFIDFLAGFAIARLTGRGCSALRSLAAVLPAGPFFTEVLVRFAGAADRLVGFGFVAFAIGYFDFLSFRFCPQPIGGG
jgi:hypothetical protein